MSKMAIGMSPMKGHIGEQGQMWRSRGKHKATTIHDLDAAFQGQSMPRVSVPNERLYMTSYMPKVKHKPTRTL